MTSIFLALRARPRLLSALLTGIAIAAMVPGGQGWVTRALLGWNLAIWLYLALVGTMMARADHLRLRRIALAQAEGAATVLSVGVLAALVSLVGIVVQLSAAKLPGAPHAWPHLALALSTVVGSWLLMPTLFALSYASQYYATPTNRGLRFPDADAGFAPHYIDFMYFSITIAVASQTADVCVVSPRARRLVMLHSLVSFVFNTAILALTINVAASMF